MFLGWPGVWFPTFARSRNRCDEVKGVVVVLDLDVADVDPDFSAIRDGCLTLNSTPQIPASPGIRIFHELEEGYGVTTVGGRWLWAGPVCRRDIAHYPYQRRGRSR
ncbi:MAG: hypothetical protein CM15mP74_36920 [Halieaceae bacterium]|nr:MAG: hypothetical protein CM15mP74_36920 [Halieaceae bacterium]